MRNFDNDASWGNVFRSMFSQLNSLTAFVSFTATEKSNTEKSRVDTPLSVTQKSNPVTARAYPPRTPPTEKPVMIVYHTTPASIARHDPPPTPLHGSACLLRNF